MNVFLGERLNAPGQGTAVGGGRLADCPVIRPEGIYVDGHRVIRFGMDGAPSVGVDGVGDLFAYREMWDPFIRAHFELWQYMKGLLESAPTSKKCPEGLFAPDQIKHLSDVEQSFCASLRLARMYTSNTDPYGIPRRWNAWSGLSSADMLANAQLIVRDLQATVMAVGGPYKDELVRLARLWKIEIELPDVPSFTTQQRIIANIEGAFTTAEGVLEIIGYGAGQSLEMAGDTADSVAESVRETAKAVPEAVRSPLIWVGVTAVLAVVGAGVLIYYAPRKRRSVAA